MGASLKSRYFVIGVAVLGIGFAVGGLLVRERSANGQQQATANTFQTSVHQTNQITVSVSSITPNHLQLRQQVQSVVNQLEQSPPAGLDASGFTEFVFSKVGVQLPRTISQQAAEGTQISNVANLQPGDLVFFSDSPTSSTVTFVGIYLQNHEVAALTTHGIHDFPINSGYWQNRVRFGVNLLG